MDTVCQTYLNAPELAATTTGIHTVCVDEMTSIQALERIQKTIPMQPGQSERIEFEYQRHGTTCLICNWDVVAGQVISPTLGPTRTEGISAGMSITPSTRIRTPAGFLWSTI